MKKIIIFILCMNLANGFAQGKLKKADKLFAEYSFADAAKTYDEYFENESKSGTQPLKNAADAYYNIDDKRNALKYYQKLYDIQGETMDEAYFLRYAESLKAVMDYEKADRVTKEYLSAKGDDKKMRHYANQKRQIDSIAAEKALFVVKNLDVNSAKADFGTAFYGDKIVYASSKDTTKYNEKLYNWNKQPFLDLYVAERSPTDGTLFNSQPFLPNAQSRYHDAAATFSADGKTIYYSTNILKNKKLVNDKAGTNNFKIVKGTIEGEQLINPKDVFFDDKTYSTGHPFLTSDGKLLFFASDMPGGMGESDIYVCQVAEDGTIGPPKNVGLEINTVGNEMFPSMMNGKLYFASDGHYGLGGLDIYESKMLDNMAFDEPRNLGAPINANKDDFAYIIDSTDKFGYFSSNRLGGKGDDDIYYFTKAKPVCNQIISGKVVNAKTKLPIADATITVRDLLGDALTVATTDASGLYRAIVPCSKTVKVQATKANHTKDEKQVETKSVNDAEIPNVNFELSTYEDLTVKKGNTEKIDINPIFFDYNKSNINSQAAAELDRVIFAMTNFENVKIKIEAHTDSRGKDSYNLKLSDDRAKSTRDYIISKGIDASRIESAIGYGESRLTNKCKNGVKCTEEQHLANRRSDFIVIEK